MKYHNIEWRNDYLILVAIILVALAVVLLPGWIPVQAATPAPPEVKECQEVNTAKVSDTMIFTILRCEPENGAPYLINSAGFMMPEEQ